ncbi:lipopolysaccharide biosynthesis protein [Zhongshania aliphaticivorans]|uniref:lipopolysaccharide biosynthesis protein n=1 Tax=Zhongshania aliphaticivorans TaxID=1470434 RepID=UPI0012E63536|nr:oligosaccharide flippase family protein [Zhongshania aliphaticivorans]CAA0118134.1 Uncharacterised protein [Zhongshania aliphaticivorans]
MSSREKSLIKNSLILAVGNVGSRIIKFFLLPLYAIFLSPQDLGIYDLVFTLVLLLEPLVTLKIVDAIYRNLIAYKGGEVVWTGALFSLLSVFVVVVLFLVFFPTELFSYKLEASIFLISKVFHTYFSEVVRGYRKNGQYAVGGVALALLVLSFSLVSLYSAPEKVSGLLLATAAAHFCVGAYFLRSSGCLATKPVFQVGLLRPLLIFSAPLVPSAMNWWAILLASRVFVSAELGLDQSAIVAIAMTFPTIVVVLGQVFFLAWQESSFLNMNVSDRDQYFSKVYNNYINFQLLLCVICFCASAVLYQFFYSHEYFNSWRLSYLFFWGAIFNNLSTFLSVGYTGNFTTTGASFTAVIGTFISVMSTWLTVPYCGIWAAPIGFFLGLLSLWLIRSLHTRKYFRVKINLRSIGPAVASFAILSLLLLVNNILTGILVSSVALILAFWANAPLLKSAVGELRQRINFRQN